MRALDTHGDTLGSPKRVLYTKKVAPPPIVTPTIDERAIPILLLFGSSASPPPLLLSLSIEVVGAGVGAVAHLATSTWWTKAVISDYDEDE
jgi:hypothetical protein